MLQRKKINGIYRLFRVFYLNYKYKIILLLFNLLSNHFLLNYFKNNYKNKLNLSKEYLKIYSTLYFTAKEGKTLRPNYNKNYIIKNYNNIQRKGICLCTIGKKENLYVRDFVEYYKQLGFDKIIIFDNNNLGDEKFEDVLKDYVKVDFVKIIDIRGIEAALLPTYNYCYQKYKNLFDWIAFFDFDEYLFFKEFKTIHNYLYNSKFQKCQTILFNWYFYDDNDLEKYEKKKVIERFKRPKTKTKSVKSIIRGNLNNIIIPTAHIFAININYFCNSNGQRVFPENFYQINSSNSDLAYIKHFSAKTAEEFCNKILKGDAQFDNNHAYYKSTIKNKIKGFFNINKITLGKIDILEKCLNLTEIFGE